MHYYRISRQIIYDGPNLMLDGLGLPFEEFLMRAYALAGGNYPRFFKMDLLSKLGFLASERVLQGLPPDVDRTKVAVLLTNASSSLDTDKRYWETASQAAASPSLFVYTLPNIVCGEICIRHGLKGESNFFLTKAFDADLIGQQLELLWQNTAMEYCLTGWVEGMANQADVFLYLASRSAFISAHEEAKRIKPYY